MPSGTETVSVYRSLAEEHHRQNHPQERDRFLLLAADAALVAGRHDEAERLRRTILAHNPNHLLKPYSSLQEAMQSQDILAYVQQLRRSYPLEKAKNLLANIRPTGADPGPKPPEDDYVLPLDLERTPAVPTFGFLKAPTAREDEVLTEPQAVVPVKPRPEPARPAPARPAPPAAEWPGAPTGSTDRSRQPPGVSPSPPGIFRLQTEMPAKPKSPPRLATAEREPQPVATGAWVGTLLGIIVVVLGLALLAYIALAPVLSEFGK